MRKLILILIFIRGLNSTSLSINAFSILFSGQMQIGGLMKYTAIREVLIYRFILSILLVSILSQIINI